MHIQTLLLKRSSIPQKPNPPHLVTRYRSLRQEILTTFAREFAKGIYSHHDKQDATIVSRYTPKLEQAVEHYEAVRGPPDDTSNDIIFLSQQTTIAQVVSRPS